MINLLTEKELKTLQTTTDLTPEFNIKLKDNFEHYLFKSTLQLQDAVMNYAYTKGLLTFNDNNRISFLKEVCTMMRKKFNPLKKN